MRTKKVFPILFLSGALVLVFSAVTVHAGNLTPREELGKELFFDKISDPDWMSCATCHALDVGTTGPIPGINKHGAVYRGAVPTRFGDRKPPSTAYSTFSPILHVDMATGEFVGGSFWDGRATGEDLGSPAADQAGGPFLNPVEQNNPSKQAVLDQVCRAKYVDLFVSEFQKDEPGMDPCNPMNLELAYDFIAQSIAAYEASPEVNQFSSKFDLYWAACLNAGNQPEACGLALGDKGVLDPTHILNDQEWDGLIEYGEYCAPCHVSHIPGPGGTPPLFTDFTFDNIGFPRNPENPFYEMDEEFLDDGTPINPLGRDFVDFGLGNFLRTRPEWMSMAYENDGKFKVPTVRNVDKRYGNGFPKAFGHNGFFKSLKTIVHFYNTRDVKMACPDPFTTEKDALAMNCWPVPEVDRNVNREIFEGVPLGNFELTDQDEDAIVAFLKTLSDGFDPSAGPAPDDPHPHQEICNDGIDNDRDGLTDCRDTKDCRRDPACRKCK